MRKKETPSQLHQLLERSKSQKKMIVFIKVLGEDRKSEKSFCLISIENCIDLQKIC